MAYSFCFSALFCCFYINSSIFLYIIWFGKRIVCISLFVVFAFGIFSYFFFMPEFHSVFFSFCLACLCGLYDCDKCWFICCKQNVTTLIVCWHCCFAVLYCVCVFLLSEFLIIILHTKNESKQCFLFNGCQLILRIVFN